MTLIRKVLISFVVAASLLVLSAGAASADPVDNTVNAGLQIVSSLV